MAARGGVGGGIGKMGEREWKLTSFLLWNDNLGGKRYRIGTIVSDIAIALHGDKWQLHLRWHSRMYRGWNDYVIHLNKTNVTVYVNCWSIQMNQQKRIALHMTDRQKLRSTFLYFL